MALDLGNPIAQQARDDAHGRAYEEADAAAFRNTPEKQRERDLLTIEAMENFGGEFVRNLGAAARVAEPANLADIKKTFGLYWSRYEAEAGRRLLGKRG